jgi:hypothetical protein
MDEFAHCSVCARTPLVGEQVSVVRRGRREAIVCDQCLRTPRAQAMGEPIGRERIRSTAGAENVARIFPRPVEPVPARGQARAGTAA